MSLYLEGTGCCAVMEIEHLSHEPNPEEAMRNLCRLFVDGGDFYHNDRYKKRGLDNLPGHIIFTGVVKHRDGSRISGTAKYGQRFATLIRRNRLGKIVESYAGNNRVNHDGHIVKVWVWTPSVERVKAWWGKNMSKEDRQDHEEFVTYQRLDNLEGGGYHYYG